MLANNVHIQAEEGISGCKCTYFSYQEFIFSFSIRYVWCHLDMGYMQGMCDLVAPLLVIFDDEALTYSCFCELMKRMSENFPQGGAMDSHFSNMRYYKALIVFFCKKLRDIMSFHRLLIQILDSEIYDLMHQNGDYTHFYFCYRWFLLDFKRGKIPFGIHIRNGFSFVSSQICF